MIESVGVGLCVVMLAWGVFAGGLGGIFFSNFMRAVLTNAAYLIAVIILLSLTAVEVDADILFWVSITQVPVFVIAFGLGRFATWMEMHRRPRTY